MSDQPQASLAPETDSHLPRKLFHILAASIIPTLYYLEIFSWPVSAALVCSVALVWGGADWYRLHHPGFNEFALGVLGPLLKTKEAKEVTSSSHMLIASALVILFMEKEIACASLFFIAMGDPAAAVVGKRFGKIRFKSGKSLEGTLAMFAVCLGVGLALIPSALIAVAGALAAALAELYIVGLDDNLAVPLLSALAMTAVSAVL